MMFRSEFRSLLAWLALMSLLPALAAAQAQLNEGQRRLCRGCHSGAFASTAAGPHRLLDGGVVAEGSASDFSCTACHGDVSEHIAAAGRAPVFAFGEEAALERAAVCAGCHADDHPGFAFSAHAQADLACNDCHSQHRGRLDAALLVEIADGLGRGAPLGPRSRVCLECHSGVAAEFELNERHRLREGILQCTSCHDPHARASITDLGGFRQQACMDCHADKGGPHVFEHGSSRIEGCTACHQPHGAQNRRMLTHQSTGELCLSCHATVPQFHLGFSPAGPPRFGLETQCTNCHASIHGSNFDPFFLR